MAGTDGVDVGTAAVCETIVIDVPVEDRERVGAPEGAEGARLISVKVIDFVDIDADPSVAEDADPFADTVLVPLASC